MWKILLECNSSRIPHEIIGYHSNSISVTNNMVECPYCGYVQKLNFETVMKILKRKSKRVQCSRCHKWFTVYNSEGEQHG